MKLKIFSVALMVFTGLMAHSTLNYAQSTIRTDTAYTKKMQKMQEQMRQLQKEMSDLRADNAKKYESENKERNAEREKRNAERQQKNAENLKRINEQVAVNVQHINERVAESIKKMDETFEKTFSNFGSNFRFNSSDSSMQKRVERGEAKGKTKSFSKSYPVNGSDKLQIDNRYGKVTINTWDKNEFKVDVQIKTFANDNAEAQKLLDKTSITDSKDGGVVAFKTMIDNNDDNGNSFWGISTNNGKTTVHEAFINYTIYMPSKNALDITNRYGGIEIPNFDGKVNITNSYGGLLAKSLTNAEDKIDVKYGSAKITSFAGSGLDIAYGSLSLDAADKLNANIRYSSAKIGKLTTSGTISLHYGGGLEIVEMDKNLKSLTVNSSYSPVRLNTTGGVNADFDVTVHNTNFIYDSNTLDVTNKTPADGQRGYSSTKTYKGHIGKGSPEKTITVNSSYGSVKFN